jgi:hypothetical protein
MAGKKPALKMNFECSCEAKAIDDYLAQLPGEQD